jgi:photosystem II stability/assembly factor-like uncharacterized protein
MSLRLTLALALALAAAPRAWAESWIPVGPEGGDARGLAVDPRDPRVLYLGTADGTLYRSGDGGRLWARLAPGFPRRGMSLDDIVVDPRGRVLVGYWEVGGSGGGVAISRDEGRHFDTLPGIDGQAVRSLALAPSNPDVIVAGTMTGVMRSRDGGASWQRISPAGHPDLKTVGSVAVDPLDPERIYAGTWHLAWRTSDGGGTWQSLRAGMIDDSDVMTLTVDRRSRETVYATACSGIYRSHDAGFRWHKLRGIPGSSRRTRAFVQHPERPETLYAGTTEGLWASADDGGSWRRLTPSALVVNAVVVLPGGTLVLGADGAGVLRSEDGGASWQASSQGFSERFVSRLLFDAGRRRVIAGLRGDRQHGGVRVAPSPEGPWSRFVGGLPEREVLALALAGDEVLAGTDDGVFLSDARSGGWRRLPTISGGRDLHPRVTDLLAVSERVFLAATSGGLLRSGDRGESWLRVVLGPAAQVSALASSAGARRLLAATALGVHESVDLGLSWSSVSQALSVPSFQSLAFRPGDERVVFATTPRGLLRSDDSGRTWTRLAGGLPTSDIAALALHPDGRTLYAAGYGALALYRSDDGGESWRPLPVDGLGASRILLLSVDPASPGRLLAGGASGGLHLLDDPRTGAATAGAGERP